MAKVLFDENSLREDVVNVWGEYGAHVEVLDTLIKIARNQYPEGHSPFCPKECEDSCHTPYDETMAENRELRACLRIVHMAALQNGYQPDDIDDRVRVRDALGENILEGS